MRSLLVRLARSPFSLGYRLFDTVWVPLWLKLLGVDIARRCRFDGLPTIKIVPGARVVLGTGVSLYSRQGSNSAGLPHPTILAATSPQSSIIIDADTGISGASISAKLAIHIGQRVLVGAGACIWDNDFHPLESADRRVHPTAKAQAAPISIEDDVFIGARALILKGVTIGRGAVVGAGAVVTRDVAPGSVVAGNPARAVKKLEVEKQAP